MDIKEKTIAYFRQHESLNDLREHSLLLTNITESQYYDSIQLLNVISDLEEIFQIRFKHNDIRSHQFTNIQGIIKIIQSHSIH